MTQLNPFRLAVAATLGFITYIVLVEVFVDHGLVAFVPALLVTLYSDLLIRYLVNRYPREGPA